VKSEIIDQKSKLNNHQSSFDLLSDAAWLFGLIIPLRSVQAVRNFVVLLKFTNAHKALTIDDFQLLIFE
jgi:hypothetical protein